MRIGARTLSHISFVTPVRVERNVPPMDADGLLPTVLFQRVFRGSKTYYGKRLGQFSTIWISTSPKAASRAIPKKRCPLLLTA
jgi:hypothetical protein